MTLTLYVGTRNWSTWSLRAWLALKAGGLAFDEVDVPLRHHTTSAAVRAVSPSGFVPVLQVSGEGPDFLVWDSLAIAEFAAERAPGLWPADVRARAWARSISAEMHSGFAELRRQLSMAFAERIPGVVPEPAVQAQIARIVQIWSETRAAFGAGGPYLFGAELTAADAFYAPVVSRFRTYGVALEGAAAAYAEALWAHPFMQAWLRAADAEVKAGLPTG